MNCSSVNCSDVQHEQYDSKNLYTWCTNCGNYGIHGTLKRALVEECLAPHQVLLCFDIGCHGNGSDKIQGYRLHGLHGRVIPVACGAALANRNVPVIAFAGDGATMSEGVGHLVHAIRSNYNITFVLHNNTNYGLTTGQASATTPQGVPMNSSPDGVTAETLIPAHFALSLFPSFVARTFSGNIHQMTRVIRSALNHKGFSFVEILQACPTYSKHSTHKWYMERIYDVAKDEKYDSSDLQQALAVSQDVSGHIATGILYQEDKPTFYDRQLNRQGKETELVDEVAEHNISDLFDLFR